MSKLNSWAEIHQFSINAILLFCKGGIDSGLKVRAHPNCFELNVPVLIKVRLMQVSARNWVCAHNKQTKKDLSQCMHLILGLKQTYVQMPYLVCFIYERLFYEDSVVHIKDGRKGHRITKLKTKFKSWT